MNNNYDALTDAVRRLQNGDGEAFNEIYELTNGPAHFTALKITGNEDDAQDVLQDSYVKILNKINDLEKPESFTSWFNKVVTNTARNLKRRNDPAAFSGFENEEDEDETPFADRIADESREFAPPEAAEKEELRQAVISAIDELSDEKRAVIVMQYYNDMPIKDIAAALEINENTAKSRLFQAKKELEKKLRAHEKKYGKLLSAAPVGAVAAWALKSTA